MDENQIFEQTYPEDIYQVRPIVTILIAMPWANVEEPQRQLLTKILQSIRLPLASVRIVHQVQFDVSSWKDKLERIIAFLPPPKGVALYEALRAGETSIIFSDPLETLITDDAAKRKLWSALKGLFPS